MSLLQQDHLVRAILAVCRYSCVWECLVSGALQKWNTMPAENRPSLDVSFVAPVSASN